MFMESQNLEKKGKLVNDSLTNVGWVTLKTYMMLRVTNDLIFTTIIFFSLKKSFMLIYF